LKTTHYDFIFSLLPLNGTHGGHKAATLMALRSVQELQPSMRPVVLGVTVSSKNDTSMLHFSKYGNYSETETLTDTASFHLDRTSPFGYKNMLNYKIITNWEIAEHKSQGVMQMDINRGDYENFWFFKLNAPGSYEKTKALFETLKKNPYPSKTY
jgi:hypothetical protein